MSTVNKAGMFLKIRRGLGKHSPEILTGLGIAGMISTAVLAVKATPKAIGMIETRKDEELLEKMPPVEAVKTAWTCYIPAAVTGVVSIACIIGANTVSGKRQAALAAAYSLSETALKEYKSKAVEILGEKKEQAVQDAVAKEKIGKNPVGKNEVVITGKGETLCYDAVSGRYFKSDIENLRRSANRINRQLISDMYISLNEFYDEIGLGPIRMGDELGWDVDKGLIDLRFSSHLAEDGTPCLVVDYAVEPRYRYGKYR